MPRTRRARVALAIGLVALAAGAFVLWPQPDRVTQENVGRIGKGMSLAEVEAILGPPGDYRTGPTDWRQSLAPAFSWENGFVYHSFFEEDATAVEHKAWAGDFGDAKIVFGPEGVSFVLFWPAEPEPLGPLQRALWRAKRQWHHWFPE